MKSESGSGNVFADLGLEDAGELYAWSHIGFRVHKLIIEKKLRRRQIAPLLGIGQTGLLDHCHHLRNIQKRLSGIRAVSGFTLEEIVSRQPPSEVAIFVFRAAKQSLFTKERQQHSAQLLFI